MTKTTTQASRRPPRLALALSCAALVAAAPAQESGPAPLPALTADGVVVARAADPLQGLAIPGDEVRLSNELTVTRWANALTLSPVRAQPFAGARAVARLRAIGTSRAPEIYGVLRARVDRHRRIWLQVRVPGRPNGRVGWVPATSLGVLHVTRLRLVVDRRRLRASLYRGGRRIWKAPIGVGKPGTPTPAGRFFIARGDRNTIGRMRNASVNRLARLMPPGTPLRIR